MTSPASNRQLLRLALLGLVAAVLGFYLWTTLCFVPFVDWNDVRLAPTFMLWHGSSPYPGLDAGPLTTWTYGPMELLLNLPALLAPDAAGALLIGGVINLLCAAVPAAVAIRALPAGTPSPGRVWAWLLCLAAWPASSLQYIQSDNAAVAFGLLSCTLLAAGLGHPVRLTFAALFAACAVWSKQTSVGLILAQIIWVFLTVGWAASVRHAVACAAWLLALGVVFVAWFGFDGLWVNLVALPRQFPLTPDPLRRTQELGLALALYVVLPAAGLLAGRRAVFRRASPWLLPALVWLFLLPMALLSFFGHGGSSNSLNGVLYLFPVAACAAVAWVGRLAPRTAPAWIAAGIVAVLTRQLSASPLLPLRPMTEHLAVGEALARRFPGRVYFPWNPLVTFFAEHRFYHTEDGMMVREITGHGRARADALRDLPPAWSITAIPAWRDYGSFKKLQPADARPGVLGRWSTYAWTPPANGGTPAPR